VHFVVTASTELFSVSRTRAFTSVHSIVLVNLYCYLCRCSGRALAQAVSRWLPTAAARVRTKVRSCAICGGQSGTGIGFLSAYRFPLPVLIPPTAPDSPSIIWGWYNRPISGRRTKWTQSHPTPRNCKKSYIDLS
jgi:hypothetical protein